MSDAGIYQLLLHLPTARTLAIGRLGTFEFATGWYVYTGSARRHLSHRVARHRAAEKVLRWHIDYLTSVAPVVDVRLFALDGDAGQECAVHRRLAVQAGAEEPVRGFGSSDCRCRTHLVWLGAEATGWEVR